MNLCLYICHSWFALNKQLIHFCTHNNQGTQYIYYIPQYLESKINTSYIKNILNIDHSSHVTIIVYNDFIYGNVDTFMNLESTKIIDFKKFKCIQLHFDLSFCKTTQNFGSLLISHHFIKHAIAMDTKMEVHVWDSGISSLSERKTKPEWLIEHFKEALEALKSPEWGLSFYAFIRGGYYAIHYIFKTVYHFVRPEFSDNWYKSEGLTVSPITLNTGLSREQFKLYLILLGITSDELNKLKTIGDLLFIKNPLSWFRLPIPQIKDSGCEKNINYQLLLGDIINTLELDVKITFLSGERDTEENLNILTEEIHTHETNYSLFTLEALFYLKIFPKKIITFLNLYAYILPQSYLQLLIINENESYKSIDHLMKYDFDCPSYYLNETEKLYPTAKDYVVCTTPDPIGDSLYAMACLKTIKNAFDKKIAIIGKAFHGNSLFTLNKSVSIFFDKNDLTYEAHAMLHFGAEHGLFFQLLPNAYNFKPGHIIDNTLNEFKLPVVSSELSIDMKIASSCDKIDKIKFSGRTVLLHPNKDAKNRSWTSKQWNIITDLLINDGWQVIIIGSSNASLTGGGLFKIDNPKAINLVNKLTLSETLYLMSKSNMVIACDSGPVALAGATDIAIVALYSIVKGDRRIPYRHGTLGWNSLIIDLNCQYVNCFDLVRNINYLHGIKKVICNQKYISWPYSEACISKATGGKEYSCLNSYTAYELYNDINKAIASKLIHITDV